MFIFNDFRHKILQILDPAKFYLSESIALSNPTKKLDYDVVGLLNKSTTSSHCGFALANLQSVSIVDYVPDENIGKNLEGLCIRRSNLKYIDGEIVDSNFKKIGKPHILAGKP